MITAPERILDQIDGIFSAYNYAGDNSYQKLLHMENDFLNAKRRLVTLEKKLETIGEAAANLCTALVTCHICGNSILIEDGPTHCEDCGYDCEEHASPDCEPISKLYDILSFSLIKAGLWKVK